MDDDLRSSMLRYYDERAPEYEEAYVLGTGTASIPASGPLSMRCQERSTDQPIVWMNSVESSLILRQRLFLFLQFAGGLFCLFAGENLHHPLRR